MIKTSHFMNLRTVILKEIAVFFDFKVQDIEMGLYRESSAYIYDLYKDELNFVQR